MSVSLLRRKPSSLYNRCFQLQLFYLSNISCYLVQIAFYVGAYYCEAVLDDPKPL